jgi:hypothetical protein
VGGGDAGAPFYRVVGGAGRLGGKGERVAAVVLHDGGGGGRFGRGSARAVVESDEGGCSGHFRSGRGCREVACAHAHEAAVATSAFGPGRKTTRRVGRAGPSKGQGPMAVGGGGPIRGERGVGQPGWKERWAVAGLNPEPGENSKRNYFQISIDFRIWQNFGKLYKDI